MDELIKSSISKEVSQEGYSGKLGIILVDLAPGYALVEMVPGGDDLNIFGTVHGGAIYSLADEAFQVSCNSHGTVAVALSVNMVYHHPAEKGLKLRAESREMNRSKKTATYEIRVSDERGTLIASCQALAYRKGNGLPFINSGK